MTLAFFLTACFSGSSRYFGFKGRGGWGDRWQKKRWRIGTERQDLLGRDGGIIRRRARGGRLIIIALSIIFFFWFVMFQPQQGSFLDTKFLSLPPRSFFVLFFFGALGHFGHVIFFVDPLNLPLHISIAHYMGIQIWDISSSSITPL